MGPKVSKHEISKSNKDKETNDHSPHEYSSQASSKSNNKEELISGQNFHQLKEPISKRDPTHINDLINVGNLKTSLENLKIATPPNSQISEINEISTSSQNSSNLTNKINKLKIDLEIEKEKEKEKLKEKNVDPTSTHQSSNYKKHKKIVLKATGGSLNKDIRQYYKFKEVLGGGHFGTVRIGYKRDEEPKIFYAIKSISKKNLSTKDFEDLIKEVEILSSLDHPNIIKFYETYNDQYYFHIVMELCKGKEVFDKIIEEGHITEQKVAKYIYKVLSAISYCHSNGITHRDLKPENILFENADPDSEIKLIDFGLSRKYNSKEKMHTILGTPYYVAPEVLKGDYDEKCDIWSIGALSYIMLSGDPPYNGNSNNEIFNKIMNSDLVFQKEKWKNISKEAKDFVRKCMLKTPEARFTAIKAIEHPWFQNILAQVHSSLNLPSDILENLRNFSTPQKLKKLVLKFLVNTLSDKEIKKLRKAFYAIDLDHTGLISKDELKKAFTVSGLKISEEELQKIIDTADDGESERLDYSEFIIACLNQKTFIDKEKLVLAFKYFDVDDSGYICSSDIKNAMLRSGKQIINTEEIDKIIEEVNQNTEKISLEEFLKLFGYEI
jgi:calcium-dependent protein kinase